jgi:hypothetical protein
MRIGVELAALFGVLVALDAWVTGGTGFGGLQPSPWWIPVLAMALAYGTGPGVAAASIAAALWLWHEADTPAGGDYLDHLFHLSLPPLLWFVVATLVGEVTIIRARRHAQLQRRADAGQRNVARLSEAFERLASANRTLQVQVATDTQTTGHVIATAAGLGATDPAERRAAIGRLVALAAGTRDFTLYRTAGDEARAWLRGVDSQARPDALPASLLRALKRRADILHVGRRADRALLATFGVVAVPLADGETDDPAGCLMLHAAPLATMNAHRMAELTELAAWLAPLLVEETRANWATRPDKVA